MRSTRVQRNEAAPKTLARDRRSYLVNGEAVLFSSWVLRPVRLSIVPDKPAYTVKDGDNGDARRFVSGVRTKAEFNNRATCSRSVWRSVFVLTYLLRHHLVPILEEVASVLENKRNIPDRICPHDPDQLLMHGAEVDSYLGHGLPQKTSTRQGDAVATIPFPCPATGLKFMTSNLPGPAKSNDGDPNLNQRLRIRSKCPSSYSNIQSPLVLRQYQP